MCATLLSSLIGCFSLNCTLEVVCNFSPYVFICTGFCLWLYFKDPDIFQCSFSSFILWFSCFMPIQSLEVLQPYHCLGRKLKALLLWEPWTTEITLPISLLYSLCGGNATSYLHLACYFEDTLSCIITYSTCLISWARSVSALICLNVCCNYVYVKSKMWKLLLLWTCATSIKWIHENCVIL